MCCLAVEQPSKQTMTIMYTIVWDGLQHSVGAQCLLLTRTKLSAIWGHSGGSLSLAEGKRSDIELPLKKIKECYTKNKQYVQRQGDL